MTQCEYELIDIDDLYPFPENYRFDPVSNFEEAILTMVEVMGPKLITLTRSILDRGGIDPSILPNVIFYSHENKHKYIVLEGNRRVTALKIIHNVDIIIKSRHYEKYKTLLSKYNTNNLTHKIMCAVYSKKEDSDSWTFLRHTGENDGEGLISWDPISVERFKVTTGLEKPNVSYCLNKYLIENNLKRIPPKTSTTFLRILNSSYGKKYYGLSVLDNNLHFDYSKDETMQKIDLLYKYIEDGIINSRNCNKSTEIESWISLLDKQYLSLNCMEIDISTSVNATQPLASLPDPIMKQNINSEITENPTDVSKQITKEKIGPVTENNILANNVSNINQNTPNSNPKVKNPKFMAGLNYSQIDTKKFIGISRLCDELIKLSHPQYNSYAYYPIASAMLLRALIEQVLHYHLIINNHWKNIPRNAKNDDPTLSKILFYYRNNLKALIPDSTYERLFKTFFETDSKLKDVLDLSIHHPNIVKITRAELDIYANTGLVDLLNYLLCKRKEDDI